MFDPALFQQPFEPVSATDATGTVSVTVGPDGLPESIGVRPGWLRTLGSEALAAAVTEAAATAARQQLAVLADAVAAERPPPLAAWDEQDVPEPPATSRSLSAVIRHLQRTKEEAPVAARPEPHVGAAGYGALTITLSADGDLSCVADPHWVSEQDVDELAAALDTALASARAGLAPVAAPDPQLGARVNDLVAELLAALGAICGEPGGRNQHTLDPYP